MDMEKLENRIYYLAGGMDEVKRILNEMRMERALAKEQTNKQSATQTINSGETIRTGEPA